MKWIMLVTTVFISCCAVLAPSRAIAEEAKVGVAPQITRNPFVIAPYSYPLRDDGGAQRGTTGGTAGSMKVKGIMLGRDYATALIGHTIVKTGDIIGGFTVSEISRTGVTLSNGEMVINIFME